MLDGLRFAEHNKGKSGVYMIDSGKMIYSLQKFMILQTKLNPQTSMQIPDEYAYAWYVGLYPFFHDNEWHENVKEYFNISEEKVTKVIKYLDSEWLNKKYYTFYEIEKYYKYSKTDNDVTRNDLLCILRYVFLHGGFDNMFWDRLLEKEQYPIEAASIISDFDTDKIYLV